MSPPKLAIICTHPIQYSAPVFRALAEDSRLDVRVFYTWSQTETHGIFDSGFGAEVKWDIPLLEGYAYQFVPNVARRPGVDHFHGLDTPSLAPDVERWKPDAVLVYTWNSKSHLQALRHFKGRVPVLFRGDSTLIDRQTWWRGLARRAVLRWVYRHVDVAIAVGSNNRDYFAWCGIPPQSILIAPHSVDTVRFSANSSTHDALAAQWRDDFDIDSEAVVILFAGKLQSKKNPLLLLNAFIKLNGNAHLVFVGNGELEHQLKAAAASYPNVHFMPFQNQLAMPAVYRLGDLFVLPSQGPEETWGLALNESMASGRAVIASSKVGGARDLIDNGDNGWVFESGNQSDLESLLGQAIDSGRSRLHAMGAKAQAQCGRWCTAESARLIGDAVLHCLKG